MAKVMLEGAEINVATIFCVGRNYVAHIAELGNDREEKPVVFLKPQRALLPDGGHFVLPSYAADVHHECELVLLIGRDADYVPEDEALSVIAGYGIGLDMTARDIQTQLKQKGHPWTRGKGFRGAACVSAFVAANRVKDPGHLQFSLKVNGECRQQGDTSMMLLGVAQLVSWLSCEYGLQAGDLVYTGTPGGVAAVHEGDVLQAELNGLVAAHWDVVK